MNERTSSGVKKQGQRKKKKETITTKKKKKKKKKKKMKSGSEGSVYQLPAKPLSDELYIAGPSPARYRFNFKLKFMSGLLPFFPGSNYTLFRPGTAPILTCLRVRSITNIRLTFSLRRNFYQKTRQIEAVSIS